MTKLEAMAWLIAVAADQDTIAVAAVLREQDATRSRDGVIAAESVDDETVVGIEAGILTVLGRPDTVTMPLASSLTVMFQRRWSRRW